MVYNFSLPQFRLLNEFQHEVASFWIRYPEWCVELMFNMKISLIVVHNVHWVLQSGWYYDNKLYTIIYIISWVPNYSLNFGTKFTR